MVTRDEFQIEHRRGGGRGALRHGMSYTPTHNSWLAMKGRCFNPNNAKYKDYGGRGITVCDRWLVFENFLEDMGVAPDGHSTERVNVNGNYEPSNCKWIENKLQARNKQRTLWLSMDGETKSLAEWAEITGIKESTIRLRVKKGWSDERALTAQIRKVGETNIRAKLTESQVLDILSSQETTIKLGAEYGVSPSMISKIRTGKHWGHLNQIAERGGGRGGEVRIKLGVTF